MRTQQTLRKLIRNALLLSIATTLYPLTAYCIPAGRADFVSGNVAAIASNGSRRVFIKGSEINAGETIQTSADARAQIRFIDGGFISLQPNSLFRVDDYNFKEGDNPNEKGFFSLLKGSIRAITGAIGKTNRQTYRVTTATATLGIRGTGYRAEILDDGLLVSVGEGAVILTNNAGQFDIKAGYSAFVSNINTLPVHTHRQPRAFTPPINSLPPKPPVDIAPGLAPKMQSGPGYTLARVTSASTPTNIINTNAQFNDTSQLTSSFQSTMSFDTLANGTISSTGTDGIIGWGRWDGTINSYPGPYTGVFHYFIAQPTLVMPTTGTATYNLMGYTNPSTNDGTTGWKVSGNLNVDFNPAVKSININLQVANPSLGTYTNTGSLTYVDPSFSGGLSTTGSACISACSATVSGFFAGNNASRAGLTYQISDVSANRTISGAAAFARAP